MRNLFAELKRRHVIKVAGIYLAFLVAVLAFANDIEGTFDLPDWTDKTIVLLALLGLPIAVIIAWAFELTPHGIVRTPNLDATSANDGAPPTPKSELASIAVLPFRNASPSQDTFLATAIPLELNNTLSRVERLRIVSGHSTAAHTRNDKDLRNIASELDVSYVISGSVAQFESSIRVIAELYDASNDTLLWTERFDLQSGQAFEAGHNIAEAAAMAFGGERLRLEVERARKGQTTDQAAWELVQRARAYLLSYTRESVETAVELLLQAVERDADYATGHAQLALVTAEKTLNAIGTNPEEDRAAALTAIEKAENLAPSDPVILRSAGVVHAYIGDNLNALRLLRRATKLAPYDLGAWGYFGWPLVATGRSEHLAELHDILDRLLAHGSRHPGVPYWHFHRSVAHCCEAQYESALDSVQQALSEQPRFAIGWMHNANLLGLLGRDEAARTAVNRSLAINSEFTPAYYANLMRRLADTEAVAQLRVAGLRKAALLSETAV